MAEGIYNGIVNECYDHDVIPKMQEYLWNLRTKVRAFASCNFFDCSTMCFAKDKIPTGRSTDQCVSSLALDKTVTDCKAVVQGFYGAMLYEVSAHAACSASASTTLVSYMQAMDAAYNKGLCYGVYATHL